MYTTKVPHKFFGVSALIEFVRTIELTKFKRDFEPTYIHGHHTIMALRKAIILFHLIT